MRQAVARKSPELKVFIGEYHSVHGNMEEDLTEAVQKLGCVEASTEAPQCSFWLPAGAKAGEVSEVSVLHGLFFL